MYCLLLADAGDQARQQLLVQAHCLQQARGLQRVLLPAKFTSSCQAAQHNGTVVSLGERGGMEQQQLQDSKAIWLRHQRCSPLN